MIPVIFGEVLFDCFEDGSRVLGGAPFNVAWHLAAMGQRPMMISSIGRDRAGDDIRQRMRAWNMDECGLQVTPDYPTGSVEVELLHGEPSYDIVQPAAWDVIKADQLPQLPAAMLLYHGTLALRSQMNRDTLQQLKRLSNAQLFIDVNLRAPWWDRELVMSWLMGSYWIKLNQHELKALLPNIINDAERIQRLFKETRADSVLLTCGEHGAKLFRRDGRQWQIRPENSVVQQDAVGAGDAFASVFLLGVLQNWPTQLILQRAQEFALAVIGLRGATTDNTLFYKNFQEKWGM